MNIPSEIIAGCCALLGAIIGGFFTIIASRQEKKWNKAKSDIVRLCRQVMAYNELERLYSEELGVLKKKCDVTVQKDMRRKVEENGLDRPKMTKNDANNLLEEWTRS